MSASDKKKLRKELASAQLTEKQKKAQSEAKKLRALSVTFVVIMLVVALTTVAVLSIRAVNNSGIIDRNTIAAIVGNKELNSIQMNYYLVDQARNTYSQWKQAYGDSVALYASLMGIDVNSPIDEQMYDAEKAQTWADFFLDSAMEKARSDYALYNKAVADNFKLPEADQKNLDSISATLTLYALYGGYSDADKYLSAIYGYGADVDSYIEYSKIALTASAYYNQHRDALTYDATKIDEYEKEKFDNYSSFDYASYYVSASSYLKGTKGEDGTTTYTDADRAAALAEADRIVKELATNTDVETLDKAIAALEINKDNKSAATTKNKDVMYSNVPTDTLKAWLADAARAEGEIGVVVNETVTTDADGKETKTTNGYYVVVFQGRDDNLRMLANVRHLLVSFEGGTLKSDGSRTYSDAEKATAKGKAEALLKQWKEGEKADEAAFIELVKKNSTDEGTAPDGGLIEDIHKNSSLDTNFRSWAIDPERKASDTGVIESVYGYHVMYYVGDGDINYRDYMITDDMRAEDMEKWHEEVLKPVTVTEQDTHRLKLDLVMSAL